MPRRFFDKKNEIIGLLMLSVLTISLVTSCSLEVTVPRRQSYILNLTYPTGYKHSDNGDPCSYQLPWKKGTTCQAKITPDFVYLFPIDCQTKKLLDATTAAAFCFTVLQNRSVVLVPQADIQWSCEEEGSSTPTTGTVSIYFVDTRPRCQSKATPLIGVNDSAVFFLRGTDRDNDRLKFKIVAFGNTTADSHSGKGYNFQGTLSYCTQLNESEAMFGGDGCGQWSSYVDLLQDKTKRNYTNLFMYSPPKNASLAFQEWLMYNATDESGDGCPRLGKMTFFVVNSVIPEVTGTPFPLRKVYVNHPTLFFVSATTHTANRLKFELRSPPSSSDCATVCKVPEHTWKAAGLPQDTSSRPLPWTLQRCIPVPIGGNLSAPSKFTDFAMTAVLALQTTKVPCQGNFSFVVSDGFTESRQAQVAYESMNWEAKCLGLMTAKRHFELSEVIKLSNVNATFLFTNSSGITIQRTETERHPSGSEPFQEGEKITISVSELVVAKKRIGIIFMFPTVPGSEAKMCSITFTSPAESTMSPVVPSTTLLSSPPPPTTIIGSSEATSHVPSAGPTTKSTEGGTGAPPSTAPIGSQTPSFPPKPSSTVYPIPSRTPAPTAATSGGHTFLFLLTIIMLGVTLYYFRRPILYHLRRYTQFDATDSHIGSSPAGEHPSSSHEMQAKRGSPGAGAGSVGEQKPMFPGKKKVKEDPPLHNAPSTNIDQNRNSWDANEDDWE